MVTKKRSESISLYILAGVVCLIGLMPALWMILTSLKPASELVAYPPTLFPKQLTLRAYEALINNRLFSDTGFGQWLGNSILVATTTSAGSVALSALAAYALSRFRFVGSRTLRYAILITQMLPGALMVIPFYMIMRDLQLLDSLAGLVLAYTTYTLPFSTYMLRGYFDTIPPDVDEMAMIDGCSQIGALMRVVLPLAAPGIAVTTVFAFIHSWNEFLFALVLLNSYKNWTIPIALATFRGQYLIDWGVLFAGSFLVSLPVIAVFVLLQRYLVSGMTAGAVKG